MIYVILQKMPSLKLENSLRRQGFKLIAGVDEVGLGPLAGPIVAAAVILPEKVKLPGINDSKKLSADKRAKLFVLIKDKALAIGIARVEPQVIDEINIREANKLALKLAIENLPLKPDYVLVDGRRFLVKTSIPQQGVALGDATATSIAAASIIAKVTRDRLMCKYHELFPEYCFDLHKGYGTKEHYRQIKKHGPSSIHRRSFSLR